MTGNITRIADNQLALQERAQLIKVLESSLYPGASSDSIEMVLGYCQAAGLDPLQKPVHIVPMWDSKAGRMRDVVMPGVNLYRIQASRSGECGGVTEPEFGPDVTEVIGGQEITFPQWCRVTVRRVLPSGAIVDYTAKELWKENYAAKGGKDKSIAPNAMWTKRPYGQLAKCAEAQAFRKAFPELAGAYTAEEMDGKDLERDITPPRDSAQAGKMPARHELPAYPKADFDANLNAWRAAITAGRKTADEVIALVSTKGVLNEDQKKAIRGETAQTGQVVDAEPQTQEQHA